MHVRCPISQQIVAVLGFAWSVLVGVASRCGYTAGFFNPSVFSMEKKVLSTPVLIKNVSGTRAWSETLAASLLLAGVMALGGAEAASSAPSNAAQPAVRVTDIDERTHPFETLYCARQPIHVRFIGSVAEVVLNGETRILRQAIAASGARYVGPEDESTVFWGKGSAATVTWSGQQLPLCAAAGAIIPPFRASGNEPFWSVSYDGFSATLKVPGWPDQSLDRPEVRPSEDGQVLQSVDQADAWKLVVTDGLCMDSMTGMPHPQKAELLGLSGPLHGCGGSPARMLQGGAWRITQLGSMPVVSGQIAEIQFLENNLIAGTTGCNRFFGQYALTGEALTFKGMGSTRMACSPELMAQEDALMKLLTSVNRFSFKNEDVQKLQLHSGDTLIQAAALP